ncbi:hypothetical protein [Streptomyces lasiicapitis]|uniref:hypothetical protein n=1 Tax=Streptomyces lasiicapitis TaxID=1923961 RepID=UPI0036B19911
MPNSMPVSDIAAAEPAFSGGAEPTPRSVPRAIIGLMPMWTSTKPVTRRGRPPELST